MDDVMYTQADENSKYPHTLGERKTDQCLSLSFFGVF